MIQVLNALMTVVCVAVYAPPLIPMTAEYACYWNYPYFEALTWML